MTPVIAGLIGAFVGAFVFAGAGVAGVMLSIALIPRLHPFEDGPAPVDVKPWMLIAGSALFGAFLAWHHIPIPQLLISVVLAVALTAIWYCDARTGIVPDAFTLIPLALAFGIGALNHVIVGMLASSVVVFAPFAIGAFLSKGRGIGWGDAKLAALGGALLGMMIATFSLGVAALVAVVVASIRNRAKPVPIAFAPYMVCAIALGIAYQIH
jgi:prepilin signal peptidase PulO-like enzyme (type II secretory pathway)